MPKDEPLDLELDVAWESGVPSQPTPGKASPAAVSAPPPATAGSTDDEPPPTTVSRPEVTEQVRKRRLSGEITRPVPLDVLKALREASRSDLPAGLLEGAARGDTPTLPPVPPAPPLPKDLAIPDEEPASSMSIDVPVSVPVSEAGAVEELAPEDLVEDE